ncbi:unnamed protein product [Protopolystoma xenopodis]|uniref:Uncharacterized protein n=1 Tax=Protopolystoma xenopodis TaxID=117903 RepID=A0A448XEA0_9PLAT|nr:unnamed protein product [Protopolystoma xenopodis]
MENYSSKCTLLLPRHRLLPLPSDWPLSCILKAPGIAASVMVVSRFAELPPQEFSGTADGDAHSPECRQKRTWRASSSVRSVLPLHFGGQTPKWSW